MNTQLLAILKHPALFVVSIIGTILCLLLGIYYVLPGVYHVSLSHSHPPLDPKPDYAAAFLVLAVICAGVAVLARRAGRTK
ncbi:hypothetical protein KDW_05030 [Dictyobacter vulcani]|uniref:Uncharacterized protein n=1 Tax=Dictyobacter vulcani TaxID=2607529 RepID=A0A5J4KJL2_9CHLR|nr:hypothetical protein [Dictyobacter vulcani]GER86341.1 hypothetical protein KDW_05030 [Dictyobacter vulcani]